MLFSIEVVSSFIQCTAIFCRVPESCFFIPLLCEKSGKLTFFLALSCWERQFFVSVIDLFEGISARFDNLDSFQLGA